MLLNKYSEVLNNNICMINFWRKNSILYSLIQVCTTINFCCWPSYTMLIWACTIIRIQPFNQQFFFPLKSRCIQSKKLKGKLIKSQKNEANFADSRCFCSFFCFQSPHWFFCFYYLLCTISYFSTLYYYSVLYYYWLFEILPPYTIISPYTITNFCRFVHPIPLFCPILLFGTSEYVQSHDCWPLTQVVIS